MFSKSLNLSRLFYPQSIAVIGASPDENSLGNLPIRFLLHHGYRGRIYPVNPRHKEVMGFPCYSSLKDIPGEVDLALIGVPRQFVLQTLQICAEKRIPFVILFSAGFAEVGAEGKQAQEELKEFVKRTNVRIVGPNCIGLINTHDKVAASFTSGLEMDLLLPGHIGLITQSGGIGNCVLTRAYDRGVGLSYFVSCGNEVDLEIADFSEFFLHDERTKCIALLLEDLKNPRRFLEVAEKALEVGKPIVALKVGRSERGKQAASSHTGAISGPDEIYNGFFRPKGICRVYDVDELWEVANVFAAYNFPRGDGAAILTTSGGSGAHLADLAADNQLRLPAPGATTKEKLRDLIPAVAKIDNPMDITTQFMNDPEAIARYLVAFDQDENFDLLIINFTVSAPERTRKVAERIAALKGSLSKPLIVCWPVGNMAQEAFHCLAKAGIPLFFQPTHCLLAAGLFARYARYRQKLPNLGHHLPEERG
ncbi:MAG: acetate--CoA ligase family protein [Thermodesulfobacteriota bacterium]